MATFEVIKPGLLTTIQDLGRYGYQKYGLAVSGSVDSYAHRIANVLVSNPEGAAVLEITLVGPQVKVLKTTVIAITGGDLQAQLNGKPIQPWASMMVKEGDILHFAGAKTGCRAYLAAAGGFDVPLVLGSRSTDTLGHIGGLDGRPLQSGDILHTGNVLASPSQRWVRRLHPGFIPEYTDEVDVRVILGPQEDAFTGRGIQTFLSSAYMVTKDLDRMGCRLEGDLIEHTDGADIISEGIFMGAIQVPKTGQPIVFLVGRRGIGGYTKIGGVISVDMMKLAQVKPGNTIRFHQVDIDEAHQLYVEVENIFQSMKGHIIGR
jgi:antagonist of KipI